VTSLRAIRIQPPPFLFSDVLDVVVLLCAEQEVVDEETLSRIRSEAGHALAEMTADETMAFWGDPAIAAQSLLALLEILVNPDETALVDVVIETEAEVAAMSGRVTLYGLSKASFLKLAELVDPYLPAKSRLLSSFTPLMDWSNQRPLPLKPPLTADQSLKTSIAVLRSSLLGAPAARPTTPTPSTPPAILGLAALSPFTVLRSPTTRVSTLTKTYTKNDFRQTRTSPNANTSRPPSMHVDQFQGSPPAVLQPSPLPQWQ